LHLVQQQVKTVIRKITDVGSVYIAGNLCC